MSSHARTVYLAIKFHADHRNRKLVERIAAALGEHGVTTVCVARDIEKWGALTLGADDLMRRAFESIRKSKAVVVEFTDKGVGLGIEAGYAAALRIPVFGLVPAGTEVSTTLRGVSTDVYQYADDDDLRRAAVGIADRIRLGSGNTQQHLDRC